MFNNKMISVKTIGYVRTKARGSQVREKTIHSQIIIFNEYIKALEGIKDFSHIIVLFWLNKISSKDMRLKVHPRGRDDLPLLGIFATRSMFRPNPIGLTIVELIKVEKNKLTVRGLDAFDLTPVIDIKPYDFWDTKVEIRFQIGGKNLKKVKRIQNRSF